MARGLIPKDLIYCCGNLYVLDAYAGEVGDCDLFVGTPLQRLVRDYVSKLEKLIFVKHFCFYCMMDLTAHEALVNAVCHHDVGFC